MANKKRNVPAAQKNNDAVVYQVMAALLVACIECLLLQQLAKYYGYANYIGAIQDGLYVAGWIFAGLAAAAAVCAVCWRGRRTLLFGLILAAVNLLACAAACFILNRMWTGPVILLYFVFGALALLFSLYLLYQREFFLLSCATVAAAFSFYCLSRLYGTSNRALTAVIASGLALVLVAIGLAALLAARNGGILRLGGLRMRIFQLSSPLPLYIACLLWLLCLAASLFLGAFFAYCCVFAAIAFEFVMAFYYTVKLK